MKALGLLSGGLDSQLATKLIIDQGVEVIGVHFKHVFNTSHLTNIQKVATELGIVLQVINIDNEILEIVKKPLHGYGSGMNPCIDCRILSFRKAKAYLEEIKANFIITGEVIGQRPMSQNSASIELIERKSGLAGLIVRPLCAKVLPPSIPEQKGWINREKLLHHHGRSRKLQLDLANKFGFKSFSPPAGGCLLTDSSFSKRLKESLEHNEDTLTDIKLLKLGRHSRLENGVKCIVGRDEKENETLEELAESGDIILEPENVPGPTVLLRKKGQLSLEQYLKPATDILINYCKIKENVAVKHMLKK